MMLKHVRRSARGIVPVIMAMSLVVAGCSSDDEPEATGGGDDAPQTLDDVYQALDGLSLEDRRAKLTELADAEGGTMTLYGCGNEETYLERADLFEEDTGVTTEVLTIDCPAMISRATTEFEQGVLAADAFQGAFRELSALDAAGVLAPLETPYEEETVETAIRDNYIGTSQSPRVVVWNTDVIDEADAPKTYEDVLTKYPDNMTLPAAQWDWFACVTKYYLEDQQGLTEEQAVALFTRASSETRATNGMGLAATLLAAGEFGVNAASNLNGINTLLESQAPVAFEPFVTPICAVTSGVAVAEDAAHPATGLLYVEWELADAPTATGEIPTRTTDTDAGIIGDEYLDDIVLIDEELYNDADRWQELWAGVMQAASEAPRED